jgi:hypothetical protein
MVYFLAIRSGEMQERKDAEIAGFVQGMVLRKTGLVQGEFQWIGSFTFQHNRESRSTNDQIMDLLQVHGKAQARAVCIKEEKDENDEEWFQIRIV